MVDQLKEMRPTTVAGIKAMAAELEALIWHYHDTSIEEGCAGDEIGLALSLCESLAEMTA